MTRIEKSVRELSDLHEFYRKISKIRITPQGNKAKHNTLQRTRGDRAPLRVVVGKR
jgi:hypothetical protein